MKVAYIFLLSLITHSGFGQFGIRTTYNANVARQWDQFFSSLSNQDIQAMDNSITYSVDYWLRLPNLRIEFYPNISFHKSSGDISSLSISFPQGGFVQTGLRQFGIGLTTHFYIFDFIGDCECPTFSKQGEFFKKGFFLLAGIGTDFSQKAINGSYRDGNFDFKASAGAGIDIGISDLITLSPFIQVQYFPSVSWHELGESFDISEADITTSLQQFQLGIRIGFRPDYKRSF